LERRPFLSALIVVAMAFAGLLVAITPVFETTDDTFMKGIVSGTFCVADASELMIYSNVLIGRALKALYARSPGTPWYAGYLLGTHFVSYVALLWGFLLVSPRRQTVGYFLIAMLGLGSFFLWHLSFTMTAFLAVQSGIVLLVAQGAIGQGTSATTVSRVAFGVALIILGSMIRWLMFALISFLSVPLIVSVLLSRRSRKFAVWAFTVAGIILASTQTMVIYNDMAYASNSDWRGFGRLNEYCYWVADLAKPQTLTTHPGEVQEILKSVSWSPNDFRMAHAWFFMDDDVYTEAALRESGSAWLRLQASSGRLMLASVIAMYWLHLSSWWGLAGIAVSMPVCFRFVSWNSAIASACAWIFSLGATGWLAATQKLPERVALPAIACAVISSLLLGMILNGRSPDQPPKRSSAVWWRIGVVSILLALILKSFAAGYHRQQEFQRQHGRFWGDIEAVAIRGDSLVVLWTPFPYSLLLPFDDLRPMDKIRKCVLGAIERSPHSKAHLASLGVSDLMATFSQKRPPAVIGGPEHLALLRRFVKEHFGIEIRFKLAFRAQTGFALYECVRVDLPPSERERLRNRPITNED